MSAIRDLSQSLITAQGKNEFLGYLDKAVKEIGFEYYSFGMKSALITTSEQDYVWETNYSPQWVEKYLSSEFIGNDPTVIHCLSSTRPEIWNESFYLKNKELWEEARSYGLVSGWFNAMQISKHAYGMMTFARGDNPVSHHERSNNEANYLWLSTIAQTGLHDILLKDNSIETDVLSERELEVLKWSAEGKSSYETGIIIAVTESTVNFHLKNAVQKLNACNRVSAVAKAIRYGLI